MAPDTGRRKIEDHDEQISGIIERMNKEGKDLDDMKLREDTSFQEGKKIREEVRQRIAGNSPASSSGPSSPQPPSAPQAPSAVVHVPAAPSADVDDSFNEAVEGVLEEVRRTGASPDDVEIPGAEMLYSDGGESIRERARQILGASGAALAVQSPEVVDAEIIEDDGVIDAEFEDVDGQQVATPSAEAAEEIQNPILRAEAGINAAVKAKNFKAWNLHRTALLEALNSQDKTVTEMEEELAELFRGELGEEMDHADERKSRTDALIQVIEKDEDLQNEIIKHIKNQFPNAVAVLKKSKLLPERAVGVGAKDVPKMTPAAQEFMMKINIEQWEAIKAMGETASMQLIPNLPESHFTEAFKKTGTGVSMDKGVDGILGKNEQPAQQETEQAEGQGEAASEGSPFPAPDPDTEGGGATNSESASGVITGWEISFTQAKPKAPTYKSLEEKVGGKWADRHDWFERKFEKVTEKADYKRYMLLQIAAAQNNKPALDTYTEGDKNVTMTAVGRGEIEAAAPKKGWREGDSFMKSLGKMFTSKAMVDHTAVAYVHVEKNKDGTVKKRTLKIKKVPSSKATPEGRFRPTVTVALS